ERRVRAENRAVLRAVERTGIRDVSTVVFWAPQVLAPLYLSHRLFAIAPYDELFLGNLLGHGVHKLVCVHGALMERKTQLVTVKLEQVLVPPQQVMVFSLAPGVEP